jgi:MFS family permease
MANSLLQFHALRGLTRDGWLLFVTRFIRLFAYGFLSVVLFLYLAQLGYSNSRIGLLLTLTLVGDTAVSLWLTTRADRIGRRRMLLAGGALMIMAGLVFALSRNFVVLVIAATIGVISPSGNEVGPFLAIEQASLAHVIDPRRRTAVFAWYALAGSLATALGSLAGGVLTQALQHSGLVALTSYRVIVVAYALLGLALVVLFTRVSAAIEVIPQEEPSASASPVQAWLGLSHSHKLVMKLSGLFALMPSPAGS